MSDQDVMKMEDYMSRPHPNDEFIYSFNQMSDAIHQNAVDHGWWEQERNDGELLMLIVSEVAEGMEGLRKDLDSEKIPGFKNIEEELADAVIRIMDMAQARGYRLPEAILAKHEYNKTRSYKHGNKRF